MATLDPRFDPWRDEDFWPPEVKDPIEGACAKCQGTTFLPAPGEEERIVKPCDACERRAA